jgi:hypothetical protein
MRRWRSGSWWGAGRRAADKAAKAIDMLVARRLNPPCRTEDEAGLSGCRVRFSMTETCTPVMVGIGMKVEGKLYGECVLLAGITDGLIREETSPVRPP